MRGRQPFSGTRAQCAAGQGRPQTPAWLQEGSCPLSINAALPVPCEHGELCAGMVVQVGGERGCGERRREASHQADPWGTVQSSGIG